MAITRRQFVGRLGALAAAAGLSQGQIDKLVEAFAYSPNLGGTLGKPRVVWIHGAECTGCSTSLLGIYEDPAGTALVANAGAYNGATTAAALDLAGGFGASDLSGYVFHGANSGGTNPQNINFASVVGEPEFVNIADVVIDVIDLLYHETIMSMGSDLAAQWLQDFKATNASAFVLVVEGALQPKSGGGAWGDDSAASQAVSWCSIGIADNGSFDHDMAATVGALAGSTHCLAVIPIGQCATFGGYPAAKPPLDPTVAGFDTSQAQTGAMGVYDYLTANVPSAAGKVINVPGCPTNPWWFVLTVVAFLVDYVNGPAATPAADGPLGILDSAGNIKASAVDSTRRLKIAYPYAIHGPYCPRFNYWREGTFATKPGDPGCLQLIGCKGPGVRSACGVHGWNGQQPENSDQTENFSLGSFNDAVTPTGVLPGHKGGHCTQAGHPCMGCTEQGYPDSFVPFVKW